MATTFCESDFLTEIPQDDLYGKNMVSLGGGRVMVSDIYWIVNLIG